jgi:hypothetical protein
MERIETPTLQQVAELDRLWRERAERGRATAQQPPLTAEQVAAAAEYRERLSEDKPTYSGPIARPMKQEMDYDTARKKVWALFQLRAAHIDVLENRDEGNHFNWIFDEDEKSRIRNITRYFINDPACVWPLTKGLFFYGMPGTGKTEIFQVMERFCRENELSKTFTLSSLSEIYQKAKADKNSDPVTTNVQYDRCFDELGRFVGPVISYGDPLDINEAIIEQRYARSRRYGQITHFIANATPNDLSEALTPMVFDRLRSMCTGIHFIGKSKRT